MKHVSASIVISAITSAASAQSFNIDIGQPGAAPPDAYAAAGLAGHWLSLPCTQGVNVFNLVNIHGNATNVSMSQVGGTDTLMVNDPDVAGDDATLMDDFLITHTSTENCLFLDQMIPGQYEVLVYARMPAQPTIMSRTHVDQEPGSPYQLVGGPWPGHQQEHISYSRHIATVSANGTLGLHAGVPPGGSFTIGAAMNAVQIRRIVPGDTNNDEVVNTADLLNVINNWGACPTPCPPSCAADLTGDCTVNVADLLTVINHWG